MAPRANDAYAETLVFSERVAERPRDHPRPQRRLRGNELLRADEGARVRVAQVLAGERETPGVLGDADRGVVGRIGGILETASRGTDGSAQGVGRIRTRLRKGMGRV